MPRPGYVSHTQYEFGSILRFIEENWNLKSLHATDVRANSIADMFDFSISPRAYVGRPALFRLRTSNVSPNQRPTMND